MKFTYRVTDVHEIEREVVIYGDNRRDGWENLIAQLDDELDKTLNIFWLDEALEEGEDDEL